MNCRYLCAETLGIVAGVADGIQQYYSTGTIDGNRLGSTVAFGAVAGYIPGAIIDLNFKAIEKFRQGKIKLEEKSIRNF